MPWTPDTSLLRRICCSHSFLSDDNPKERQLGLFFGNALMSKCSEVWVFGEYISSGMEAEIRRAKWKNYRLRYFTTTCEEVTDYA